MNKNLWKNKGKKKKKTGKSNLRKEHKSSKNSFQTGMHIMPYTDDDWSYFLSALLLNYIKIRHLQSKADRMQILISNCISKHLRFLFCDYAIIDMTSRTFVVVNTSTDGFYDQINGLLTSHIIFIFGFKDSHSMQRAWTHRGKR